MSHIHRAHFDPLEGPLDPEAAGICMCDPEHDEGCEDDDCEGCAPEYEPDYEAILADREADRAEREMSRWD